MPAKPLTAEQKADTERLRQVFAKWQKNRKLQGLPSSQEAAGAMLGFNQSAMNQYLGGKIPLNARVLAKVAALLGIPGELISPALASEAKRISEVIGSGASTERPDTGNAPRDAVLGPFAQLSNHVANLRVEGIPDAAVVMIEAAVAGAQALTEAMAAKVPADRQTDAKLTSGDSNPGDQAETTAQRTRRNADEARSPRTNGGDEKDESGKHRTGNS
jgi:hypothetical protein